MNIKLSLALTSFALILEAQFGYPDWLFRLIKHPVTHIGAMIGYAERRLNRPGIGFFRRRVLGLLTLVCVHLVTIALAALLQIALLSSPNFSSLDFSALDFSALVCPVLGFCLATLIGSSLIAQKSLYTHVEAVAKALEQPASTPAAIEASRQAVAHIVGRDVTKLDRSGVARAAIESLAENFSDAIIAPAFYLALGGLPGGFLYKAINTADSMTGHKTPRYLAYGFCAAKLDDLVNWPAARLCVLWIWLAALILPEVSQQGLWRVVRRDARSHPSPNSGWPEAAFAGALGLKLGGPRAYAGQTTESQWIGDGRDDCGPRDIRRALKLYLAACIMHGAGVALLTLFLIARF